MTRRLGVLAWLRLIRTHLKIEQFATAQLKPYGLSLAQFDVIAHIGAAEGVSQQELADALLVSKGNVCQLLDRLEARGLVRRHQEGRTNRLFLTEAGHELHARVLPAHEAAIAEQFAALSSLEQAQLHQLLRKLDRRLHAR
jgi:DNA-binding MarR family transcriptional regulator